MTEILLPIENQLRGVIWLISEDFSISTLPRVEKLSFTLGTDAGDTDTDDTDTDNTDIGDVGDTEDETTDPAQEPIVLPELTIERPVIIAIDIPPEALQTENQIKEEPKAEEKEETEEKTQQPTGGEAESTSQGAEEGGAE